MLEPQAGMQVGEILEWAEYAEKAGFGYILRSDHLMPTGGRKREEDSPSPECWVTLGAVAADTNRIKFGPLVTPVGFRNPALLARMACTLHSFSEGRFLLGFGAGWFRDVYLANGYEFPPFRVRFEQFLEALKIVRPLTEGRRVDFQGRYFAAHTDCLPRPKGKVHLIIGGRTPRVVKAAAQMADEWNIFGPTMDLYKKLRRVFDSNSGGREMQASQMGTFLIGENTRELRENASRHAKLFGSGGGADAAIELLRGRGAFFGTGAEFVEQVNERLEAGIQKLYFQILNTQNKAMVNLLTRTLKEEF